MAKKSEIRDAIRLIVRCLAPYGDPVARRRTRADAKRLVECTTWPGEDADGAQIAQLALLRLMWLQREAHRAARAAHLESVALLARTAIETCIVGLYCLVDPDAPTKLNDQNAHHLKLMLRYLPASFVSEGTRKRMVDQIGTPSRNPSVLTMAETVDAATGNDAAQMLYHAYYAPLSTFFAHGGGISLLRHVGKHDMLTERPMAPWFHRSALHIVDSSLALLASRVADVASRDTAGFEKYFEAHRSRTLTPVFAFGGHGVLGTIRWQRVLNSVRAMIRLGSDIDALGPDSDTPAAREALAREQAGACFAFIRQPGDDELFEILTDELVYRVCEPG